MNRERIGLLPQSFDPPARLTPGSYWDSTAGSTTTTDGLFAEVVVADTHYESLPGGQQRRTCVAVAPVNDPEFKNSYLELTGLSVTDQRAGSRSAGQGSEGRSGDSPPDERAGGTPSATEVSRRESGASVARGPGGELGFLRRRTAVIFSAIIVVIFGVLVAALPWTS